MRDATSTSIYAVYTLTRAIKFVAWRKARNAWVAPAEPARCRGKGPGRQGRRRRGWGGLRRRWAPRKPISASETRADRSERSRGRNGQALGRLSTTVGDREACRVNHELRTFRPERLFGRYIFDRYMVPQQGIVGKPAPAAGDQCRVAEQARRVSAGCRAERYLLSKTRLLDHSRSTLDRSRGPQCTASRQRDLATNHGMLSRRVDRLNTRLNIISIVRRALANQWLTHCKTVARPLRLSLPPM